MHVDPRFRSRIRLVALTLGVLGLASACDKPASSEHPARVPTPGQANLPPTPDLNPAIAPEKYPDGAYSVRGVFAAKAEEREGEITVRGTVATMHVCPPGEKICKPAPHLTLTDTAAGVGKRLLVGGEMDLGARGFAVGQEATVVGKFATSSPDGLYFAPQGMVLLSPVPEADAGAAARR